MTPPTRIAAVINTASGTATAESATEMEQILAECGITSPTIISCVPADLTTTLNKLEQESLDALIVLGGDGTIRTAAARARARGPALIPLPGGTMNLLPKAFYGNRSWQDALRETLKNPVRVTVSGGEVAGERFFIASIFGAPSYWAEVRESLREGALGEALEHGKHAFSRLFAEKIRYHFNDLHEGSAEALIVTCPLIADTLTHDRQVFEAAVIDVKHVGDVLALAGAAAFGKWYEDSNVAIVPTSEVRVTSDKAIPAILDGESIELSTEAVVTFIPNAFTALVPKS